MVLLLRAVLLVVFRRFDAFFSIELRIDDKVDNDGEWVAASLRGLVNAGNLVELKTWLRGSIVHDNGVHPGEFSPI